MPTRCFLRLLLTATAVRPIRRVTSTSGNLPNNFNSHFCQSLRPLKSGICSRLRFSNTPDTVRPRRRAVSLSECFPRRSISHFCQYQGVVKRLPALFSRNPFPRRRPTKRITSLSDIPARYWRDARFGEYTTSGATINASLIAGLDQPYGIAISPVPEPSTAVAKGITRFLSASRRSMGCRAGKPDLRCNSSVPCQCQQSRLIHPWDYPSCPLQRPAQLLREPAEKVGSVLALDLWISSSLLGVMWDR